jgi:hypothetical protein
MAIGIKQNNKPVFTCCMFRSKSNFVLFLFLTKAPTRSIVTVYVWWFQPSAEVEGHCYYSDCWVLWRTRIIAPPPEIMRWIIHGRGSRHPSCTKATTSGRDLLCGTDSVEIQKNSPTAVIRYFCNITSFIMSREKTQKNHFSIQTEWRLNIITQCCCKCAFVEMTK